MESLDAFDGQIKPDSRSEDIGHLDLKLVHPLMGLVYVKGAEPGDILEVTVRHIDPSQAMRTIAPHETAGNIDIGNSRSSVLSQ